jgi:4,5-dihydroxyphthalate decarboxylase
MPRIKLSLCIAEYDRVKPLLDEIVKPDGIDLTITTLHPSDTFYRMLKYDQFDVSEMSLSSFLIAKSQGRKWTAIPVFPYRGFFHTWIYCNTESGIKEPADLAGKKFGLPEYQITAALWIRGTLEHDFGVPPKRIKWFVERLEEKSHGGTTGFKPPQGVSIQRIPETESLGSLLSKGELDAVIEPAYPGKTAIDRTEASLLAKLPNVSRLFSDPKSEGIRYFRQHGFAHMNHTVIVKTSILEQNPWVALNLYTAFVTSKEISHGKIDQLLLSSLLFAGAELEDQLKIFGKDPYPYGIKANNKSLETLVDYSYEQGLTSKRQEIRELFDASTLDT